MFPVPLRTLWTAIRYRLWMRAVRAMVAAAEILSLELKVVSLILETMFGS